MELDVERLCSEFGDEYVLVVRFHQLVRQPLSGIKVSRPDFLIDGSHYADIQELLLVSDVLITDYSSLFFDYAVLRRPMLFFTYDLENYRDVLRGFYLDFESEAPGPLLTTNHQLVAALKYIDGVAARYRDQMRPFYFDPARHRTYLEQLGVRYPTVRDTAARDTTARGASR